MGEKCGRPIFPQKGFVPTGHCVLPKGHDGHPKTCTADDGEADDEASGGIDLADQIELDLSDFWKAARDLPDDETPNFPIADET